jgi:hypothetical protein
MVARHASTCSCGRFKNMARHALIAPRSTCHFPAEALAAEGPEAAARAPFVNHRSGRGKWNSKRLDDGAPITEATVTREGGDGPPERGKTGPAPCAQHIGRGPTPAHAGRGRETPKNRAKDEIKNRLDC